MCEVPGRGVTVPKFKRVILKLSGEALLPPDSKYGISLDVAHGIAQEIASVVQKGVQVGVVIGAGNIFRGSPASSGGMDRTTADNMGMLATVINSLALQDALIKENVPTRVLTAFPIHQMAEPFSQRAAMRSLSEGSTIIFAGGTGNPYFTTDTAAALRALEVHADIVCKGTKVDGVYDADPVKSSKATRFQKLTHMDVIRKKLEVMDLTAISMCMDAKLPLLVFNIFRKGNFLKAVMGEEIGTVVYAE
ncbi:MAG: UMP kinase [Deltaproteobacteria bacterium]|nr:UMP kinase [Deltaproteobacteria bacterium]